MFFFTETAFIYRTNMHTIVNDLFEDYKYNNVINVQSQFLSICLNLRLLYAICNNDPPHLS